MTAAGIDGSTGALAPALAAVADAVRESGGEGFGAAIVRLVRALVACDTALVLVYSAAHRPAVLLDEFQHALRRNDLRAYLEGSYLLDPFFLEATDEGGDGVYRLRDVVDDDFIASPYFRQYYKHSHVADEVNLLVPVEAGTTVAISLERTERGEPFSDGDIERFRDLFPVVSALVRTDWPSRRPAMTRPGAAAERRHESLRDRLDAFGEDTLTPREREVVHLLIRGYDAQEAGDALGVSEETVRVHRRNAYRKLDVSSLAELFALVLDEVLAG